MGQRDRSSLIVPGQRDNGQAENLARGQDGLGLPKFGTERTGRPKPGTGCGTKWDRAEKDVLKQENNILKQKIMF